MVLVQEDLLTLLSEEWRSQLSETVHAPYFSRLALFLEKEWDSSTPIYPPKELIFNALNQVPFEKVKVVIVGQDPYHGPNQAHGLSFSVLPGVNIPPSLKNIYKELHSDLGLPIPQQGSLASWAEQGVLLLNATLTVRAHQPKSHFGQGWEVFTDAIIQQLCLREEPVIFFLWGKSAQEKCAHITDVANGGRHYLLTAPHPSPYSAFSGFFGCCHFSQANAILTSIGQAPIDRSV